MTKKTKNKKTKKKESEFLSGKGSILPSGNAYEFPLIEKMLKKLGVKYTTIPLSAGRVYQIPTKEISKLPICPDTNERYLPVDEDSGHAIYKIDKRFINFVKEFK